MELEISKTNQIKINFTPETPQNNNIIETTKPKSQVIIKILKTISKSFVLNFLKGIKAESNVSKSISNGTPKAAHITTKIGSLFTFFKSSKYSKLNSIVFFFLFGNMKQCFFSIANWACNQDIRKLFYANIIHCNTFIKKFSSVCNVVFKF